MLSVSIEAGVHRYITSTGGIIWVYLPLDIIEQHRVMFWRCDVMTVFPRGGVHCSSGVLYSEKYLSDTLTDLHV